MSRLFLWRHGRTAWNHEHRTQGQLDVELDETGIRQAAESAPRLAAWAPKLIVSSDLARTTHTAQALVDLTGLPLQVDARLRERHFGHWQGLTTTEIRERYPEEFRRFAAGAVDVDTGIESLDALAERVVNALQDVAEQVGEGGTAIVVTHGGAARVGIAGILGWPRESWHTLGVLGNCHWSELWLRPERGWQLERYNVN